MSESYDAKKEILLGIWKSPNIPSKVCVELLLQESTYGGLDWSNRTEVGFHLREVLQRGTSGRCDIEPENVFRCIDQYSTAYDEYLRRGIDVIGFWEPSYPQNLLRNKDQPFFLFVQGKSSILQDVHSVAIIGARQACTMSCSIQKRLGNICVEYGFVVVSGLAKGLDTAAHKGCIERQGETIAVLAHGLGVPLYPKENQALALEMIRNNGCLVSAYDLYTPPSRYRFLERNRIQVGLSKGVVFTAALKKGGTAYTVRYAQSLRVPVGYFFHEKIKWFPRELNDALYKKKTEFRLSDPQSIDSFLKHIS